MNGLGESAKAAPKEQTAILSQVKGTGPGRKSGKRCGAPTGQLERESSTGNLSGFYKQRRDGICRALFFCPPAVW